MHRSADIPVARETLVPIIKVQLSTVSRVSRGWNHHVAVVMLPWYVIHCEAKGRLQRSVISQLYLPAIYRFFLAVKWSVPIHWGFLLYIVFNTLVMESFPNLFLCVCTSLFVNCSPLRQCVRALSFFFLFCVFLVSYSPLTSVICCHYRSEVELYANLPRR